MVNGASLVRKLKSGWWVNKVDWVSLIFMFFVCALLSVTSYSAGCLDCEDERKKSWERYQDAMDRYDRNYLKGDK